MKKVIKDKLFGNKDLMSVIKGSGLTFFLKILGMAFSYILIWFMARFMGAGTVGEFNLMVAICGIIGILSRLGFHNSLIKFIAQARIKGKNIYSNILFLKTTWIVLSVNIVVSVILFFASGIIAEQVFHKPLLAPIIKWSAFSIFPISFCHIAAAYLRGHKKIWEFSLLQDFGNYFVFIILFIPLVFIWRTPLLPVFCWDISWFVVMLFALLIISRIPHTKLLKFRGAGLVEAYPLLKVSIPMMLTNSLTFMLNWLDTFMLGIYKTNEDVGIYSSAARLATLSTIMLTANAVVVGPKIVTLFTQEKKAELKRLLTHSTFIVTAISLPLALIMIFFPSFMLGLFGEEFKSGKWVLIILSVSQLINASTGLVGLALNMTGKEVLMQNLMIITTVLNLVLNLLLIPPYGIEGAAIATGTSLAFRNLVSFYYVKKHLGFYSLSFDYLLNYFNKRRP